MIMYLTFGDYYGDGHRQYKMIFAEGQSVNKVKEAERKMKEACPNFYMAEDYEDGSIGEETWKLIEQIYPIERFKQYDENHGWRPEDTWTDIKQSNGFYYIDVYIDIYVYLLNHFGAEITQVEIPHALDTQSCYGWFE